MLTLAGCVLHTDPRSTSSRATRSASATPSPAPAPTGLPAGVLLRVSAVAVADDGSRARLVETVSGPVAAAGDEDATMQAAECAGDGYTWRDDFPGVPRWLHLDLTSTLLNEGAWPASSSTNDYDIAVMGASGWDTVAWSGAWHHAQAPCASGYAVIPGRATGLAPVIEDGSNPQKSWETGRYGFFWGSGEGDAPTRPQVTFESCNLELSTAAQPHAANLPREDAQPGYGQPCVFGRTSG